jgi:hypothetical protein
LIFIFPNTPNCLISPFLTSFLMLCCSYGNETSSTTSLFLSSNPIPDTAMLTSRYHICGPPPRPRVLHASLAQRGTLSSHFCPRFVSLFPYHSPTVPILPFHVHSLQALPFPLCPTISSHRPRPRLRTHHFSERHPLLPEQPNSTPHVSCGDTACIMAAPLCIPRYRSSSG